MKSADWMDMVDTSAGPGACWPWMGSMHTDGYAIGYFSDLRKGGPVSRHALAVRLGRAITPGLHALHTCDNRMCVNPLHLYEGTVKDNGRDRSARGRSRNLYTKFSRGAQPLAWNNNGVLLWSAHRGFTE